MKYFAMLVFLSGCVVALDGSAPGSKRACDQPDATVLAFTCGTYQNIIVGRNCTACHSSGGAGSGVMTYGITGASCCSSNTCLTTYQNETKSNYCTALLKGQKLVEYPLSSAHTAQFYVASEIQELIDWVNSN